MLGRVEDLRFVAIGIDEEIANARNCIGQVVVKPRRVIHGILAGPAALALPPR